MFTTRELHDALRNEVGIFDALSCGANREIDGFGLLKHVDFWTGSGDYGTESQTIVFSVGDRYFQKSGHYDSWEYEDWDGPLIEVVPVEKTVIVFEPKK